MSARERRIVALSKLISMGRMSFSRSFNRQVKRPFHSCNSFPLTGWPALVQWSSIRNRTLATQSALSLQGQFLNYLLDNRSEVTVFLANGIRLQGQIRSFDNFTIQ